jgi:hypothetical protein
VCSSDLKKDALSFSEYKESKKQGKPEKEIIGGVKYVIGIDSAEGTKLSYCLMRKEMHDNSNNLILCKTIDNKDEFKREVENLAKYFNAEIWKEFNETPTTN